MSRVARFEILRLKFGEYFSGKFWVLAMWQLYGYAIVSYNQYDKEKEYRGITRNEWWPIISDRRNYDCVPNNIMSTYKRIDDIQVCEQDGYYLETTQSTAVLQRVVQFYDEFGYDEYEIVAIELEDVCEPMHCDPIEVQWIGYEPRPRAEWSLLYDLKIQNMLAHWRRRVNAYGIFSEIHSCMAFAEDYIRYMGMDNGPEPFGENNPIDILHVGLVAKSSVRAVPY